MSLQLILALTLVFVLGLIVGVSIVLYFGYIAYSREQQREEEIIKDDRITEIAAEQLAIAILEQERKALLQ